MKSRQPDDISPSRAATLVATLLGPTIDPSSTMLGKPTGDLELEIIREEARARLDTLELFRQRNLRAISAKMQLPRGQRLQLQDKDWLLEFIETAKDTSDPTLQDIWAKILSEEIEQPGGCSKRTLHMVKQLSPPEARTIERVCPQVLIVDDVEDGRTAFLNGIIKRVEQEPANEPARETILLRDTVEGGLKTVQLLIECGFLSDGDLQFGFRAEGALSPEKLVLSGTSPSRILMGDREIVASERQSGLLFNLRKRGARGVPRIESSVASIEFDAWKLTVSGYELYRAIRSACDFSTLASVRAALEQGGLSLVPERIS